MAKEISLTRFNQANIRTAIKAIIDYEILTVNQLQIITKLNKETCEEAFKELKGNRYLVVRSLTENNCYFVIDRNTRKEHKFVIKNGYYESGSLHSQSEIINFLKKLCF